MESDLKKLGETNMTINNTERHDLIDQVAEVGAESAKVLAYLSSHTSLGDSGAAVHSRILVTKAQAVLDAIEADAAT